MTTATKNGRSARVDQLFAKAPRNAYAFDAAPGEIDPVEQAADQPPRGKIKMLARSSGAIDHWYWGPIVHDFAGMKHAAKILIDYRHDDWNVGSALGFVDQFVVEPAGLQLGGELIAFKADDVAAEILFKGKAGVPFASSIDWAGAARIEDVPVGMRAVANGQTFEGPVLIVREWNLAGVAVCHYGADPDATSEFSKGRGAGSAQVSVFTKGQSMDENTQGDAAALRKQAADEARAEAKKFCDAFGEVDGAKYFAEALTFEAAQDKHGKKLAAENAELKTKLADAQQKLSATQLGEAAPIEGGDAGDKGGKKKFSDAFRLPGGMAGAAK